MMKVKNVTGKSVSFRTDNRQNNYVRDLVTVQPGESVVVPELKNLPDGLEVVGNEKDKLKKPVKSDEFDLNGDGVVDKKDASLAGKVLGKLKGKK